MVGNGDSAASTWQIYTILMAKEGIAIGVILGAGFDTACLGTAVGGGAGGAVVSLTWGAASSEEGRVVSVWLSVASCWGMTGAGSVFV